MGSRIRRLLRAVAIYYAAVAAFERLAPVGAVRAYQRVNNRLQEPLMGTLPGWGVLETTGRRTGLARRTPVGGRLVGRTFWCVAGDGRRSSFVRNIEQHPQVRLRVHGRWRTGRATVVHDDDPVRRLLRLNPVNSVFVLAANRRDRMLSVRVDLDQ